MKFYKLTTIILTAVMALAMTGCGNDKPNDATPVSATADEIKVTTTAETTAAIPQIDCFEGVEITLSGISPNGKLAIDKENASQDIRKSVSFSADLSSGIHNGDTVIITASYDDGTVRYKQTKEIVADLPFIITDISGYDLTEYNALMDEAIQKVIKKNGYTGENKLQSNKLNINGTNPTLSDVWTPNSVSYEAVADYFGAIENEKNSYLRVYHVKVNATKDTNTIFESTDDYDYGTTADFDLYFYYSLYKLIDDNGIVTTDSEIFPRSGNEKIYGSVEKATEDYFNESSYEFERIN